MMERERESRKREGDREKERWIVRGVNHDVIGFPTGRCKLRKQPPATKKNGLPIDRFKKFLKFYLLCFRTIYNTG